MKYFTVICWDKPEHQALRSQVRESHLQYLKESGIVRFAGPYLSEDGQLMVGSLVLLYCSDRESAAQWAAEDPYQKAGLFERVAIQEWVHSFGSLPAKNL